MLTIASRRGTTDADDGAEYKDENQHRDANSDQLSLLEIFFGDGAEIDVDDVDPGHRGFEAVNTVEALGCRDEPIDVLLAVVRENNVDDRGVTISETRAASADW